MLENTLSIFILLSAYFFLRSIKGSVVFLVLSGLMLCLGFLTKGFVAFFPLCLPLFYGIFFRKSFLNFIVPKSFIITFASIIPIVLIIGLSEGGSDSLYKYFDQQVMTSLRSVRTVESRWFIIQRVASELIPALIISGALALAGRRKSPETDSIVVKQRSFAFIFLALAFSGILPIMISMKQSGFYVVPSYPFIAISLSIFILPFTASFFKKHRLFGKNAYLVQILSIIIATVGVTISASNFKKIGRNASELRDIYKIIDHVPNSAQLGICQQMENEYGVHAYFARHSQISLGVISTLNPQFFLEKNDCIMNESDQPNYKAVNLELEVFELLERK